MIILYKINATKIEFNFEKLILNFKYEIQYINVVSMEFDSTLIYKMFPLYSSIEFVLYCFIVFLKMSCIIKINWYKQLFY